MDAIRQALNSLLQPGKQRFDTPQIAMGDAVSNAMKGAIKTYAYDPAKNRPLPASPYWSTVDAGNQYPQGSPQQIQAKLMAPADSMMMAGITNAKPIPRAAESASVLNAMRRAPYPEDVGILDQAVDIMRNKGSMPTEMKGAKKALYDLAEGYLSAKERPESGNLNIIMRKLQEKFRNTPSQYVDYPFATMK